MLNGESYSLKVCSYNCREFNFTNYDYINNKLLSGKRRSLLTRALTDRCATKHGVSGIDNRVVLSVRPYGGCAILRANMSVTVEIVGINCNRGCAVRMVNSNWKILLVNVHMPFESDKNINDAFMSLTFSY